MKDHIKSMDNSARKTPKIVSIEEVTGDDLSFLFELDSSLRWLPFEKTWASRFEIWLMFPNRDWVDSLQWYGAIIYWEGLWRKVYKWHFKDWLLKTWKIQLANWTHMIWNFKNWDTLEWYGEHVKSKRMSTDSKKWQISEELKWHFENGNLVYWTQKDLINWKVVIVDNTEEDRIEKYENIIYAIFWDTFSSLKSDFEHIQQCVSDNVRYDFWGIQKASELQKSINNWDLGSFKSKITDILLELQNLALTTKYEQKPEQVKHIKTLEKVIDKIWKLILKLD